MIMAAMQITDCIGTGDATINMGYDDGSSAMQRVIVYVCSCTV